MSAPGIPQAYDRWYGARYQTDGDLELFSTGVPPIVIGGTPPPITNARLNVRSFAGLGLDTGPPPPPPDRSALTYNRTNAALFPTATSTYVGLLNPGLLTRYPASGEGDYSIGSADLVAGEYLVKNKDIYGSVRFNGLSNVRLSNCKVRGTLGTGTDTASLIFASQNGRGAIIEDCLLEGRGNPWCSAIRDGGYTLRRCELSDWTDFVCLTSTVGSVNILGNWIHNGRYMEWTSTTPNMPYAGGYYTHVDGVQFHVGKDYLIRGNLIGGARANNPQGDQWPIQQGNTAAINSGDDCYNACMMIKQEVGTTVALRIERVLIEENIFGGGTACINHPSGNSNPWNTFVCQDNSFIRTPGGGSQFYLLISPSLYPNGAAVYARNTFLDNGQPVPVSNGGG